MSDQLYLDKSGYNHHIYPKGVLESIKGGGGWGTHMTRNWNIAAM